MLKDVINYRLINLLYNHLMVNKHTVKIFGWSVRNMSGWLLIDSTTYFFQQSNVSFFAYKWRLRQLTIFVLAPSVYAECMLGKDLFCLIVMK